MAQSKPVRATAIQIKKVDIQDPSKMAGMANVLKRHVVHHKLFTEIQGKNYAHVEGWQFAGGMLGLFPIVRSVESLSSGTEKKWKAHVDIVDIKTNEVRGAGYALCSSSESKKKNFDEYAILSMAQTRAIGKAYRNLIGWVMKLAGYEGTPSEEMTKVGETPAAPPEQQPQKPQGFTPPPDMACNWRGCGTEISKSVHDYSKRVYGKPYCRDHQAVAKRPANAPAKKR